MQQVTPLFQYWHSVHSLSASFMLMLIRYVKSNLDWILILWLYDAWGHRRLSLSLIWWRLFQVLSNY